MYNQTTGRFNLQCHASLRTAASIILSRVVEGNLPPIVAMTYANQLTFLGIVECGRHLVLEL